MDKQLHRSAAAVTVAALLFLGGGCSDDTPSACEAAQDLAGSVEDLVSEETLEGGRESIEDALDQAAEDLEELKDAGEEEFGDDIDDLRTQLDDVGEEASEIEAGEVREGLDQVREQADDARSSWNSLVADVQSAIEDCEIDGGGDATPTVPGGESPSTADE
jgi:chromosome segregation ATPase